MSQRYRLLISLANLALLLGIAFVGYRIFVAGAPAAGEAMPKGFKPTQLAIQSEGQARSTVQQHEIVWREIDRPKAAPAPVTAAPEIPAQPFSPRDLSTIYELVMCSFDPAAPTRSSCVLRDRRGPQDGPQRMVGVGDDLDGYKVLEIAISGDKDNRVAEVTVDDRGTPSKISLRRVTQ